MTESRRPSSTQETPALQLCLECEGAAVSPNNLMAPCKWCWDKKAGCSLGYMTHAVAAKWMLKQAFDNSEPPTKA